MHKRTARTWVSPFTRLGLPGLEGGPRTGRPPVYAPTDVGMVIQTSVTPPDERNLPFDAWTLDRLVAYLGEVKGIATAAPANSVVVCLDEIR